ncbi:DUF2721 domain-containing protein [Permianibacter sp. IMCC34836]|uniref:DUF2721 domain-containing protein n=1 Tax=Permianibacter fluminis TaxID=2738515 RepID=UPI00155786AF|nr:DUF2721 domain-containing protein [Permianibacter fluminis]NQD36883.1 DUF2721 domain-containing protein [Permianibacter fluminis]
MPLPTTTANDVADIAHVIQLSIAPVFLLTGVGALLGVLTNRLARIIDRARKLEDLLPHVSADREQRVHDELHTLSRRSKLINLAISLVTSCALLICLVIVGLFAAAFTNTRIEAYIGWLFVAAMVALIGGLMVFLREIYVATAALRIGPH